MPLKYFHLLNSSDNQSRRGVCLYHGPGITRRHEIMTHYPTDLHKAVEEQNYDKLSALLESGANPSTSGCIGDWIRGACVNNRTALHCASQRTDIRSIVTLLMWRANPNCKDDDGYTPLHYVCQKYPDNSKSEVKCVEALVDYGANIRTLTNSNLSPLDIARRMGNDACVQLLNTHLCQAQSLLTRSRVAVVKLMRGGHQLELHDLPISLWRYIQYEDATKKWSCYRDNNPPTQLT